MREVRRVQHDEGVPRTPGSWPGYVFTSEPLRLPAGRFGLGNGGGAVRSFVEYLYALAESR